MKRILIIIAAVGLCLVALAKAQEVRYDYDRGANFSNYKTFNWVQVPGAQKPDQLTDQHIRQAIESALAQKGLTKTEGNADLLIGYQVAVNQETELTTYYPGAWGYGYGWGRGLGGMETTTASTINVGTLDLDMYDPARKQLVWRGSATKTLNPSKNPDKRRRNIQKAMDKLVKNYPPKADK
jgi:hypothetical protein